MELHPVTLTIGAVCTIILIALVGVGVGCTAYKFEPDTYHFLEPYYQYVKDKKVC